MVQSDVININTQDDNIGLSTSSTAEIPSEKRLVKALNYIEDFLAEQNNQLKAQSDLKNKDVILANFDVLISRVQDILEQFDTTE